MLSSVEHFYDNAERYVKLFNYFVKKHSLGGIAKADHICYKCSSSESFESIREIFESESKFIYQSIISGRRIAIIGLFEDIDSSLGKISYLELSDQKVDGSQKEGFDHIEAYPIKGTYKEMIDKLKSEKIKEVVRPHHTTHDIDIGDGFLFRCTTEPLLEKIKREELI